MASRLIGHRRYELKDHLGNVRVVLSDQKRLFKVDYLSDTTLSLQLRASVLSYNNYYPFGLEQPEATLNSENYRFGFNGKENDREWGTGGLTQNYGFRLYNPGIAKFLSVDPLSKEYPWNSTYAFAENKPINGIDVDGLEWVLRIYSPDVSKKFHEAAKAKDVYRMRALTYWARTHHFISDFAAKQHNRDATAWDIFPAAQLYYFGDAVPKGVTVITYDTDFNAEKGENWGGGTHYFPPSSIPSPKVVSDLVHREDINYPTDVNLGSGYYDGGDFQGYKVGPTLTFGPGVGGEVGYGHLKGMGYIRYYSTGYGAGLDIGAGGIYGYYRGDGIATNENFAGDGVSATVGVSVAWVLGVESGYWQGMNSNGQAIWKGGYLGGSGGALPLRLSGSMLKTYTKIAFPLPTNPEHEIEENDWEVNLIPSKDLKLIKNLAEDKE